MIDQLTKAFGERYTSLFKALNENVIQTDVDSEGIIRVPVVALGPGGATLNAPTENPVLNNPAAVSIDSKEVKALNVTYRINIPIAEAELAASSAEYFKFLFDNVVNQALTAYNSAFGGPSVSRFGRCYCTPIRASGEVFTISDDGTNVELRLCGMWAGGEEVTREQGN